MTPPTDPAEQSAVPTAADPNRAKRERILAVSRTVHSIPQEEGGMLKRPPAPPAPPPSEATALRFWRRTALAASGLAAGLVAGLWIGRRR
jgi:hypothetical protein